MSEEDKRGSLSRHHKGLEVTHDDDIYPTSGEWTVHYIGRPYVAPKCWQQMMVAMETVFLAIAHVNVVVMLPYCLCLPFVISLVSYLCDLYIIFIYISTAIHFRL